MPTHSSLARLLQLTTLSTWGCAALWLVWHWGSSPAVAIAGFVLITFFFSLVLAAEFLALRFIGGGDPAPRPTAGELARAWMGETVDALRVFAWRQPFRWAEVPDHFPTTANTPSARGIVFIHGFVCNRGFWTPWMKLLRARGRCFSAVNLEPVFGSIDDYAPTIDAAVQRVALATGMAPVLVCHSMGGLAARAWLRSMSADTRVHHVVTIGSPHHGTWLARFSHLENGRQMRRQGDWLLQLRPPSVAFTCWYSNCDNIVFPASTATLAGADNRLVRGVAHVGLGFHPEVMEHALALIGITPAR